MTDRGRPVTVKTHRSEAELRKRSREYAKRVVRLRKQRAIAIDGDERRLDGNSAYWQQVWITAYLRHWRMSHGQSPHVGPSHGVKAERGQ